MKRDVNFVPFGLNDADLLVSFLELSKSTPLDFMTAWSACDSLPS